MLGRIPNHHPFTLDNGLLIDAATTSAPPPTAVPSAVQSPLSETPRPHPSQRPDRAVAAALRGDGRALGAELLVDGRCRDQLPPPAQGPLRRRGDLPRALRLRPTQGQLAKPVGYPHANDDGGLRYLARGLGPERAAVGVGDQAL